MSIIKIQIYVVHSQIYYALDVNSGTLSICQAQASRDWEQVNNNNSSVGIPANMWLRPFKPLLSGGLFKRALWPEILNQKQL